MKKKLLTASFILLICIALIRIQKVNADPALEFIVEPDPQVISAPGQTAKINITIRDSPAVVQWVTEITWNSSILTIANPDTDIVEGPWLKGPTNRATMFLVKPVEPGRIPEITDILMVSGTQSGSGVLATITFTGVAEGVSEVTIVRSLVLDELGTEYEATPDNGIINVVPEFPALLLLPAFLIATAIALAATTIRSRKRRAAISIP